MTNIENYLSIARRTRYRKIPVDFNMCPSLAKRFQEYAKRHDLVVPRSLVNLPDLVPISADEQTFLSYYDHGFKEGTYIDKYGVAHEPGCAAAFHMTKMYHPMENFDSPKQVLAYPLPDYTRADAAPPGPSNRILLSSITPAALARRIKCGEKYFKIWRSRR